MNITLLIVSTGFLNNHQGYVFGGHIVLSYDAVWIINLLLHFEGA